MDTPGSDTRSLGELTRQLAQDVSALVRSEIALAKVEVTDRASTLGRGAGLLAGAALFAVIVLACLVAASIAALALAVPTWLAALIVAAAALVIALILALAGRSSLKKAGPPLPLETIEGAKEDVAWVKARAKHDET